MSATEKMRALGMKALHERLKPFRPTIALETLYRWAQAIDRGEGISDRNKRLLIEATSGTIQPIEWTDFVPRAAS